MAKSGLLPVPNPTLSVAPFYADVIVVRPAATQHPLKCRHRQG